MSLRAKLREFQVRQVNEVQVATPCPVRWEEMEGDEKVRFCRECQLQVYNLSAMDVEEAAERISQDDERLCVRFYRRSDGTILTRDCPVGVEEAGRRRREFLTGTAAAAACASFVAAVLLPVLTPMQGAVARPMTPERALGRAAAAGDLPRLRSLLDQGLDPDARPGSAPTPLMRAAARGQVEAVRLLLARGARPDTRAVADRTPLAEAKQGLRGAAADEQRDYRRVIVLLHRAGAME